MPIKAKKHARKVHPMFVSVVLDETGSMNSVLDATISGYNEYIGKLRKSKGKILLSLTKFDSNKIEHVFNGEDIKNVPDLNKDTYRPGAMTPLYDAIAHTIKETETKLCSLRVKPKVLFVIITDGEENSSREFTREKVNEMIKTMTTKKWSFVYLGANQDAWAVGSLLGIAKGNTLNFNTQKIAQTFAVLGTRSCNFACEMSMSTSKFFDENDETKTK
jgi:hypothetical protein